VLSSETTVLHHIVRKRRKGLLPLLALFARAGNCTVRDHIRHDGAASHRAQET